MNVVTYSIHIYCMIICFKYKKLVFLKNESFTLYYLQKYIHFF